MQPPVRAVGHRPTDSGPWSRLVSRVVIHKEPLPFSELVDRAIPPETRYLVMDLDRTVHRGINMGELLGFELISYHSYGAQALDVAEPRRGKGRFFLDTSRPLRLLKYLGMGVRLWAYPGLYYLMWCKLAVKRRWSRRWSFLRFGEEPVSTVQRVPQTALMSQLASVPLEVLRDLSWRVWRRYASEQVITAEDIAALRRRCPGVTVILSSASPQPILEVAAEALGVDTFICSSTEEHEGYLSAPFWLSRLFSESLWPTRIAGPSQLHINSSYAKVRLLAERFPDMFRPGQHAVGVTDTAYGEDHCWAQYFDRVIDVNSSSPFAPIVAPDSPLQEVHSAQLLTQTELSVAPASPWVPARVFAIEQLQELLQPVMAQIEALAERHQALAASLDEIRAPYVSRAQEIVAQIEAAVQAYNASVGAVRRVAWRRLRAVLHSRTLLMRSKHRAEAPLSELRFRLTQLLDDSRGRLDHAPPDAPTV